MLDVGVDVVNGRDTVATFGAAVHAVPWVAVESETAMLTRYAAWCLEMADAIRKESTGPTDLAQTFEHIRLRIQSIIRIIQKNADIKAANDKIVAALSKENNKGEWSKGALELLELGLSGLSAENRARVARLRRVIARCQVVFDGWIDRVDAECAARERREKVIPVQVGSQRWANRNVRATIMSDGTKITWARDLGHFAALTASKRPAWIYSEDETEVLYNPYVDFTKLCPVDYRVPTRNDWDKLYDEICPGGNEETGIDALVNKDFQAKLVGFVSENKTSGDHVYVHKEKRAMWWGAIDDNGRYCCLLYVVSDGTKSQVTWIDRFGYYKEGGSVGNGLRLIQNV
jgi:uncharacterized protein (TIGR02145 family)